MKKPLALIGAALAIAAGGIVATPAVASAAPAPTSVGSSAGVVSAQGLNVCKTKYVKHTGPISCWFTPSMPGCGVWYEKVVTCTRY